jgi:hypothetical protein
VFQSFSKVLLSAVICGVLVCAVQVQTGHASEEPVASGLWEVTQGWDARAEAEFAAWVEQFGKARQARKCLRFKTCLSTPEANSLWTPGEKWPRLFADCADVPYILRAYFAWKTQRPFEFHKVHGRRYSRFNKPASFFDQNHPKFKTMHKLFRHIAAWIHSGSFRFKPELELTDTFPIDVNRQHVRPGTVFYETRGHVLVVSHIEDDGTIFMFDGHPDNSFTFKRFDDRLKRGSGQRGGGFRNWRWYNQQTLDDGRTVLVRETNDEIVARQGGFDGVSQYQKEFHANGQVVDYYTWVRERMRRAAKITWVTPINKLLSHLL